MPRLTTALVALAVCSLSIHKATAIGPCKPNAGASRCCDNSFSIEDFGGERCLGNDVAKCVDNTEAFKNALCYMKSPGENGLRRDIVTLRFGVGAYYFKTPPPQITYYVAVRGAGRNRTALVRAYHLPAPDQGAHSRSQGLLTFVGGFAAGSSVSDLSIVIEEGFDHGSGIALIANEAGAPGGCVFDNLDITGRGLSGGWSWDTGIFVDGTKRLGDGASAGGVRDTDFRSCLVFGGHESAIRLERAVNFTFMGGGVFLGCDRTKPGCSDACGLEEPDCREMHGRVHIGGDQGCVAGEVSPSVSYNVMFSCGNINGLLLQGCKKCEFMSYFDDCVTNSFCTEDNVVIGAVTAGATCSNVVGDPYVQNAWRRSAHISPTAGFVKSPQ